MCCLQKKYSIWSSAFYVDCCVSVAMSSFEIDHYFHTFDNKWIWKTTSKLSLLGTIRLKTARSRQTDSKHKVKFISNRCSPKVVFNIDSYFTTSSFKLFLFFFSLRRRYSTANGPTTFLRRHHVYVLKLACHTTCLWIYLYTIL